MLCPGVTTPSSASASRRVPLATTQRVLELALFLRETEVDLGWRRLIRSQETPKIAVRERTQGARAEAAAGTTAAARSVARESAAFASITVCCSATSAVRSDGSSRDPAKRVSPTIDVSMPSNNVGGAGAPIGFLQAIRPRLRLSGQQKELRCPLALVHRSRFEAELGVREAEQRIESRTSGVMRSAAAADCGPNEVFVGAEIRGPAATDAGLL